VRAAELQPVAIDTGDATIEGDLTPGEHGAVVVFAHGSGSSHHSPRNRHVARQLHESGLGTLLIDLLTAEEEQVDLRTAELRFDIDLLARRLLGATDWLRDREQTTELRVGYFGASTGAAAALLAAAERPETGAIVSRGGRPDLAAAALAHVRAPTLLIVGGADQRVLELNRHALEQLSAERQLEIVPGATHLFEEAGALDRLADLARDWFARHLAPQ
jgi:putative phosphoribosyl transferase